ncbi:MAG: RodZ domain-containing protein [Thiobacillus sp.]
MREAREAQGITLEDAAARLRLMQRQVVAIEVDDFESLGQSVFARGFVRNYARLLGLAPETLLVRMEGAPAEPAAVSQPEPAEVPSSLISPWMIMVLLGLLVLVAVPVALYVWLNSGGEEASVNSPSVETSVETSLSAPVASLVEAPAVAIQATPDPAPTAAAEVVEPAAEAVGVAVPTPAVAGSVLHIEFGGDAWTEIKDASGRMLHRQLNTAGSSVDVGGQPPFDIVIGNAAHARLTYNGRPIDLKPFIEVTVARFTLEE